MKQRYASLHSKLATNPVRLMDQVRDVLRRKQYAYATERAYIHWILSYIRFHQRKHPRELNGSHIERFLTDLATTRNVAASTQNQAMNAIVFLYREVLRIKELNFSTFIVSQREPRAPVVLTQDEVRKILESLTGTPRLMVELLYGTGMRLTELLKLRVKDLDFARNQITIRCAKGNKERTVMLPLSTKERLQKLLIKVKELHTRDLNEGFGAVYLPHALAKKYPHANLEFRWQYVFPASKRSVDPRSGVIRRHHLFDSVLVRYVKRAVDTLGITKRVTCHTFRHSFATSLLQQGTDIRTLQTLLGHKELKTTMIYLHVVQNGPAGVHSPLDVLEIKAPPSAEHSVASTPLHTEISVLRKISKAFGNTRYSLKVIAKKIQVGLHFGRVKGFGILSLTQ